MVSINLLINNLEIILNISVHDLWLNKSNGSVHHNSWKETTSYSKVKSNPPTWSRVNSETATFSLQSQPSVNTLSSWKEYSKRRRNHHTGLMGSGFLLMGHGNVWLSMIERPCITTLLFFRKTTIISFGSYSWKKPMPKYLDLIKLFNQGWPALAWML